MSFRTDAVDPPRASRRPRRGAGARGPAVAIRLAALVALATLVSLMAPTDAPAQGQVAPVVPSTPVAPPARPAPLEPPAPDEAERRIPLPALRSGIRFASPALRARQADPFDNPGLLWVEQGAQLWQAKAANGKRCADCHGDAATSMAEVAARLPVVRDGQLLNVERQVNRCRTQRQGEAPLEPGSEALLGLAAFIGHQARERPLAVDVGAAELPWWRQGRDLFLERRGQINLACTHCHDRHWGSTLMTETISQGHPNPYPAYRLEWQTLGSLQRRLRACLVGVRAEPWPAGADEYVALELYLKWRAQGLPVETPGLRR